ncbi:MAG: Imm70 family immunity protein [Candidatus Thiodiazotropha sp.]|jgi:hypothetical protein
MGLYLCVFDDDDEIDGIEVGSYSDFNFFREGVVASVENNQAGSVCPTLINHVDNDGLWTPEESENLLTELNKIEEIFVSLPPVDYNSPWKSEVAKSFGIIPKSLYDCFFDVDGEPLIERIKGLARISIERRIPILFQ